MAEGKDDRPEKDLRPEPGGGWGEEEAGGGERTWPSGDPTGLCAQAAHAGLGLCSGQKASMRNYTAADETANCKAKNASKHDMNAPLNSPRHCCCHCGAQHILFGDSNAPLELCSFPQRRQSGLQYAAITGGPR